MINKQGDDSCGYIKRNVATMEACHQMSTREWPFQGPMGKATLAIIRQVGCNDVHLPINGGKTLRLAGKTRVDESPQDSHHICLPRHRPGISATSAACLE